MNRRLLQLAFLGSLAVAAPLGAGEVRLRPRAVAGADVTLADVARLEGDDAQALGGVVVATFGGHAREATVTLASLRQTLDERGVNWGKVTLAGHAACTVERLDDLPAAPAAADAGGAAAATDDDDGNSNVAGATPLRKQVEALLAELAGVDAADLRIEFSPQDAATLDSAAAGDRYEIEPQSGTGLGRVPIVVRRWTGQRMAGTVRVTALVARRATAVVATRSVGRGDTIGADDVELREVFLKGAAPPLADLARVVGQDAAASLREGSPVYAQHVRSPLLVQRADLVTVRCVSGALVIKTVGRAVDAGGLDQVIGVRNERSRDTFYVRVTGPQEAVLASAAPAASAAPGASAAPDAPAATIVITSETGSER